MKFFGSTLLIFLVLLIQCHAFIFGGGVLLSAARLQLRNQKLIFSRSIREEDSETTGTDSQQPDARRRTRPRASNTRSKAIAHGKVGRIVKDELINIITTSDIKGFNHPEPFLMRGVSIPRIEFSSDTSVATVFVAIAGNSVEKRQVYVWLCNNIIQIRHSLSQRLRDFRRLPILRLKLVDSLTQSYLAKTMEAISREYRVPVTDDIEVEFEDDDDEVEVDADFD